MLKLCIAELRRKRGWTQQQLADAVGSSNQHIGKLEKGDRKLTLDWISRISKALDVPPADLINAGLNQAALRDVVYCVAELQDTRNYRFTPEEFADLTVLLYQEIQSIDSSEERLTALPPAARAMSELTLKRKTVET